MNELSWQATRESDHRIGYSFDFSLYIWQLGSWITISSNFGALAREMAQPRIDNIGGGHMQMGSLYHSTVMPYT